MVARVGVRASRMSPFEHEQKSRRFDGCFVSGECNQRRVNNTPDSMWWVHGNWSNIAH
jgi:hypothetical protein